VCISGPVRLSVLTGPSSSFLNFHCPGIAQSSGEKGGAMEEEGISHPEVQVFVSLSEPYSYQELSALVFDAWLVAYSALELDV